MGRPDDKSNQNQPRAGECSPLMLMILKANMLDSGCVVNKYEIEHPCTI